MISIVMATYNGEKYIIQQLDSIKDQTRKPDEVIIVDDSSTDITPDLIQKYIIDEDLQDSWVLYRNEKNIGWQRNFYKGTCLAKGDIIFFSDQDDVWLPDKIQIMVKAMEETQAGCIYGNYSFIDESGQKVSGAKTRKNAAIVKNGRRELFNTLVTMGCRMCISREIADLYINIKAESYAYDSQCGRIAFLYTSIYILESPVVLYRIHKNNTSGVEMSFEQGSSTRIKRLQEIKEDINWLKKIADYIKEHIVNSKDSALFQKIIEFQELRSEYLSLGKGTNILKLIKYQKYYSGISMFIGDFAYRHNINRLLGIIKKNILRDK